MPRLARTSRLASDAAALPLPAPKPGVREGPLGAPPCVAPPPAFAPATGLTNLADSRATAFGVADLVGSSAPHAAIREATLGPTHPDTASSLSHLATLHEAGMWYNTLLVHLSDNGGQVTDPTGTAYHGPPPGAPWPSQGNNWPLRGMKRSLFECGVRVPAFVGGGALPYPARGRVLDGYIQP